MAEWIRVAAASECPPGSLKATATGELRLVLANVDGDLYAIEDRCSHDDLPLSDGELEGDELMCIHHGARFDVSSGRPLCLPALRPVRTFPVDLRDGDLWVQVG
jgi:3-phenylpropionate/trans-cinnamate dioxygenase ferredoxin component